jgi:hypothetical protein
LSNFTLELLALHWSFVDEGFSVVVKRITEKKENGGDALQREKKWMGRKNS